jgi:hypothetical protein
MQALAIERGRFRMFLVGGGYRGIGRDKTETRPTIRNDLVQQRRDRDHALSGWSPRQHKVFKCSTAPTPASPEAHRDCRMISENASP